MDPRLALLDRHVAQAADAWLADPRDAGVYGRLVTAIEARRQYLHPTLDGLTSKDLATEVVNGALADHEPTEPATGGDSAVKPVGAALTGDPTAVLQRLRGTA